MNKLGYDLKALTLGTGEGAHLTRDQRHRGLQLISRELKLLGNELQSAKAIKPQHIEALVAKWQADGLAVGTMKNRMGWVRWWAQKGRRSSVTCRLNADYGIPARTTFNGDKAATTTGAARRSRGPTPPT